MSLASIAEWPVNNRCVSAPHDDMRQRRRESRGWNGLARSGRVVGPRQGDGSLIDARLVALASINHPAKGPAPPGSILFSMPVCVHATKKEKTKKNKKRNKGPATLQQCANYDLT